MSRGVGNWQHEFVIAESEAKMCTNLCLLLSVAQLCEMLYSEVCLRRQACQPHIYISWAKYIASCLTQNDTVTVAEQILRMCVGGFVIVEIKLWRPAHSWETRNFRAPSVKCRANLFWGDCGSAGRAGGSRLLLSMWLDPSTSFSVYERNTGNLSGPHPASVAVNIRSNP